MKLVPMGIKYTLMVLNSIVKDAKHLSLLLGRTDYALSDTTEFTVGTVIARIKSLLHLHCV